MEGGTEIKGKKKSKWMGEKQGNNFVVLLFNLNSKGAVQATSSSIPCSKYNINIYYILGIILHIQYKYNTKPCLYNISNN